MPEMLGRPMSIRIISGFLEPTSLTTLRRLLREATQRMPSVWLNKLSRLPRKVGLSSTIAILIITSNIRQMREDSNRMFIGYWGRGRPQGSGSGFGRSGDLDPETDRGAFTGGGPDGQAGVHHGGATFHAGKAISGG